MSVAIVVVALIIVTNIIVAGVVLTIENQTPNNVYNVEIKHTGGTVKFREIDSEETKWEYVGKIGEHSNFNITWTDHIGNKKGAIFHVYFFSFETFNDVKILISDNSVIAYEEEHEVLPERVW